MSEGDLMIRVNLIRIITEDILHLLQEVSDRDIRVAARLMNNQPIHCLNTLRHMYMESTAMFHDYEKKVWGPNGRPK